MTVKTESLKNLSVLYVEDDPDIAEAIRFTFKSILQKLTILPTAEEAIDFFVRNRPDIIITESVLPYSSGIELARDIKNISPDTPVMIISGHRDEKMLAGSIEAGVECYLMKPVNLKTMKKHMVLAAEKLKRLRAETRNKTLLKKVLDSSREMYLVGSADGIGYMNNTLLEFFGNSSLEEMDGSNVEVVENRHSENPVPFPLWLKKISRIDGYETVVSLIRRDLLKSDARSFIARVNRIEDEDGFAISFTDVAVMELQKKFFHNLAMKDPLTEVFNRQKFNEELSREIIRSRRYGTKLSAIMFDIDRFGDLNGRYGFQAGDRILKELAAHVSANIRTTDVFARYGGEEFIVMTPEVGLEGALRLAEKLRDSISANDFSNIDENITCSFGVVQFGADWSEEDLIRFADDALFRAKGAGRNTISE